MISSEFSEARKRQAGFELMKELFFAYQPDTTEINELIALLEASQMDYSELRRIVRIIKGNSRQKSMMPKNLVR